jgi:NAD(P)H-hydrate epimerase
LESGQAALLTTQQMYAADQAAISSGIDSRHLMAAAGAAVADAVRQLSPEGASPVLVLCGPGNNGGDGFIAASLLAAAGWPVRVALLGQGSSLKGDAAWAASQWGGAVERAEPALLQGASIVIDALFGAGLNRPLDGAALALVQALAESRLPVVAVDVPSGVNGDSGQVMGCAASARITVTFFRRKPGHLLFPGRSLCGHVVLADIGIPASLLSSLTPSFFANEVELWRSRYPWPGRGGHKYDRGHLLILGGTQMTGAARLAARAALRVGAGLATVACDPAVALIYSLSLASLIVAPLQSASDFTELLRDRRRNTILLGPGAGTQGPAGQLLRSSAMAALASGRCGVLDADIFSVFADDLSALKEAGLNDDWVLTPHEGEFGRLFGDLPGSRLDKAVHAARLSGAVVLLKGPDTVVAAPDGRAAINHNAPPELATAGSGDVLAGLIAGLLAQSMPSFEAACAAAWLHGESAREVGRGLIADDLPEALRMVLPRLRDIVESP